MKTPYLDSYRAVAKKASPAAEGGAPERRVECSNPVPIVRNKVNKDTGEALESRVMLKPCGKKCCKVCGPRLRRKYVAHFASTFARLAEEGRSLYSVTLTLDAKMSGDDGLPLQSGEEARRLIQEVFEKYADRVRYRTVAFDYAGAFEQHADGRYHLHLILALDWCPDWNGTPSGKQEAQAILRRCWFKSGGGCVADVKALDFQATGGDVEEDGRPGHLRGAAGYVVAYAFKNAASGGRTVKASQGIGYHSEAARERRREHVRQAYEDERDSVKTEFAPLYDPQEAALRRAERRLRRQRYHQPDDRPVRTLDDFNLSRRTRLYRNKLSDGRWRIHRADGAQATFNSWPGNGEAVLLDCSTEWSADEAWKAAQR